MSSVTIHDLQRDSAELVRRAESGERVLILRGGVPVAELRSVPHAPRLARPAGLAAGQFQVPDDFDAPLPESVLRDFEGG